MLLKLVLFQGFQEAAIWFEIWGLFLEGPETFSHPNVEQ